MSGWMLAAIGIAALVIYRRGPNAVWGTATLGAVIGLVVAIFKPGFDWAYIGNGIAYGAILGVFFEVLPLIFSRRAE